MSSLLPLLYPDPRGVPWDDLQAFDWVRALATCPQDPIHHAEGDVGIHTRMVLEALRSLPAYQALSRDDQRVAYVACLMHDIAKPATTRREDDGRVTAKGHSRAGDLMARRVLWELGAPFALREQVCSLIRYHQVPFFLIENEGIQRTLAEISLQARCDLLAIVAEADLRGRICQDAPKILDNIALFRELCVEEDCVTEPRRFASDHTRVTYFRSSPGSGRHPDVEVFDDTRSELVMMCGLPGSGKDTFVRESLGSLPVVSLDGLREELEVDPADNQGTIIQAARERAKEHLRRGEPFVWNATNLVKRRREGILTLAADYGARVRIVYVEVPVETLFAQNRAREAVVPEKVIRKMATSWEVPSLVEAHSLTLLTPG